MNNNMNMNNNFNNNMNNNMTMNNNSINYNMNQRNNINIINNNMNNNTMSNFNNNMRNNPDIDIIKNQFLKFEELQKKAHQYLEDKNNVNHELYEKYKKDINNNHSQKLNFTTTNDKSPLEASANEEILVDLDQISDDEKRTTVKIMGTKLANENGENILQVLDKFNMGFEDGERIYDIVYKPILKENNNNKFFVVNFRKSSYIKDFNKAMNDYLNKNEPNNKYKLYWYAKQGNDFKKYLEDKLIKKKNYKGFIKYL